jgi:hypothetical protein
VGHTCGTKCEVVCQTHGGACCGACGQTAAPPANGTPPAPAAYDPRPVPLPDPR